MTTSRRGAGPGGGQKQGGARDLMGETTAEKGRWLADPATPAQADLRQALDRAAGREADEVSLRRVWSRLADLPDVLPLSAADRVRVQAETARSRRARWPWILAASLAGATATLAFMLVESKSEVSGARKARMQIAQFASTGGSTKVETADRRSALVAPATVRTGVGETLQLALRGGTDVVVQSESVLVLDESDRPAVTAGEVQFLVPPQAPGRTFTVNVGAYRVVVVGTRFRVRMNQLSAAGGATAAVGVDEGVVEIWTDHRIARIIAGESWVSPQEPSAAVGTPEPAAPTPSPVRQAVGGSRSGKSGGSGESGLATSAAGQAGQTRGSRSALIRQVSPPLLAMASPSSGGGATAGGAATAGASGPSSSPASSGPFASQPSPPASRPAAGNVNDGLLPLGLEPPPATSELPSLALQARAARASGDSRRALGLYRSLAQRGGAAGENAEYEIGRVLRDGLNQPREAVSAWRSYRAQHPRGLLRIESDLSIIETLVLVGDKAGAAAEASDFIRRYPESERRMEVARIAGDLLRERGDCSAAISAYDLALGGGGGRGRRDMGRDAIDGVSFHRSVCVLRGDPVEGATALRTYLQTFPSGRFRAEAQRLVSSAQSAASTPGP